MNLAPIFLTLSFLLLFGKTCPSFIDDLDEARSAILDAEKDIVKTPPVKPTRRPVSAGWSVSRRRRRSTTKPPPKKTKNHNKRNEAMYQVERAMADAKLVRRSPKVTDLQNYIKMAVDNNNIMFARRALGLGFYVAAKSARGKRTTNPIKMFMDDVKKKLKREKSKDLFALEGDVTLMFAIDITGSMRGEIQAAKDIVSAISGYVRDKPVDFILSSFGDPISQGSVVYKQEGQVEQFKSEVGKLRANGGGDCAEYAYNGMIEAILGSYGEPKFDSPLYLFTDATPKDATPENKDELCALADAYSVTVNVFSWKDCFQGPYSFDDFKRLAENTGGQFFELKSNELKKISEDIINTLGGSTTVGLGNESGTRRRRKRSTGKVISIPVDETISNLVITVTTTNSPHGIHLFSPYGRLWTKKITLSRVLVYNIKLTAGLTLRGTWRLNIPYSVGKFSYSVKGQSVENVDFQYYYSKIVRGKQVPISHPLTGETARLNIVVSRMEKLSTSPISVHIIDVSGRVLQTLNTSALGKSGKRFSARFLPPSGQRFKLKLSGKTKGGYALQRISQMVDEAKPLLLKEFYTSRYYTIPRRGGTSVLFYLYNTSRKLQCYSVTLKDTLKFKLLVLGRQSNCVRGNARRIIRVSVQVTGGNGGIPGKAENIVVTVATKDKKIVTSEFIPFMTV